MCDGESMRQRRLEVSQEDAKNRVKGSTTTSASSRWLHDALEVHSNVDSDRTRPALMRARASDRADAEGEWSGVEENVGCTVHTCAAAGGGGSSSVEQATLLKGSHALAPS